ncbi:MAG: Tryptophan synthase alpha chain, partial [uncultured Thermomicrobiales bacterium]
QQRLGRCRPPRPPAHGPAARHRLRHPHAATGGGGGARRRCRRGGLRLGGHHRREPGRGRARPAGDGPPSARPSAPVSRRRQGGEKSPGRGL